MDRPEIKQEAERLSIVLLAPVSGDSTGVMDPEQLEMWSKFTRPAPPPISLADYIARLIHLLKLDDELVKSAIVEYKRLLFVRCGVQLDERNAHRFVLAATVVASKCLLDNQYAFTYYARAGGVSPSELAVLEVNLLRLLDWKVFCVTNCLLR